MAIVATSMSEVPATATLAAFLADFFLQPLRYLPTWMPCGSWKKDILVLNKDLDAMRYVHSKFVKEQIARGDWSISVAFDSLSLACYRKLCGKFYVKALGRRSQHDSRAVGQRCGIFFLCWWLRSAIRLPFGHDVLPRGS